jgi:mannose-1-phosphate guanylyltransferase
MSRSRRPKQFLPLGGAEPLLVATWRRARRLAPPDRLWVVAPGALGREIRRMLPSLRPDRLIVEPSPRDTAPAIALACATVARREREAVVGIFPTDHVVADAEEFARAVRVAARAASAGALVCLGVRPDRPATGFGYLECARVPRRGRAVPVARFVEKPDLSEARRFVRSGRHLWNAGMFVWKVDRFLGELGRTAPEILDAVRSHLEGEDAWGRATRTSVDYAVMERAERVRVVPLRAGWDDVGSWAAAASLKERAGGAGDDHLLLDSPRSVVFGQDRKRFVAILGVPGVVVVDAPDALLVVAREKAEAVKRIVDELRRRGRKDLL